MKPKNLKQISLVAGSLVLMMTSCNSNDKADNSSCEYTFDKCEAVNISDVKWEVRDVVKLDTANNSIIGNGASVLMDGKDIFVQNTWGDKRIYHYDIKGICRMSLAE